jgi:hypothetical protein
MKHDYDARARAALTEARIWYAPPHVFPAELVPPQPKPVPTPATTATPAKWGGVGKKPTMRDILRAVSEVTEQPVEVLTGETRRKEPVFARVVVTYVATHFDYSQPRIGRMLGGRDHSTITHAMQKARRDFARYSQSVAATMSRLNLGERQ